jgi:hypothetical protein
MAGWPLARVKKTHFNKFRMREIERERASERESERERERD